MPRQVKKKSDPIANGIEQGLDAAHGVVDHLLWPLKPIDSVIHGTARGVKNWLCDEHPADNTAKPKTTKKKKPAAVRSSSSEDDDDDDSSEEDDSDGSKSPPPCKGKGKGGHHNAGKFGNVKNNHANGAGNNNNANGKVNAKMGNQKLYGKK